MELELRVRIFVSSDGYLVVGASVQVVEDHLVRPTLGGVPDVRDVDAGVQTSPRGVVQQGAHHRAEPLPTIGSFRGLFNW